MVSGQIDKGVAPWREGPDLEGAGGAGGCWQCMWPPAPPIRITIRSCCTAACVLDQNSWGTAPRTAGPVFRGFRPTRPRALVWGRERSMDARPGGGWDPAPTPLPPTPPTPPSVKRVGGGFEYHCSHRYADATALQAVYELYRMLPANGGPFTAIEVQILADILIAAEAAADAGGHHGPLTLSQVLKAYQQVLHGLGLDPENDTHFYRAILRLSLDREEQNWWGRLFRDVAANSRWAGQAGRVAFRACCGGSAEPGKLNKIECPSTCQSRAQGVRTRPTPPPAHCCRRYGVPAERHQALMDVLLSCRVGRLGAADREDQHWAQVATSGLAAAGSAQGAGEPDSPGQLSPRSCASYRAAGADDATQAQQRLELAVNAWKRHAGMDNVSEDRSGPAAQRQVTTARQQQYPGQGHAGNANLIPAGALQPFVALPVPPPAAIPAPLQQSNNCHSAWALPASAGWPSALPPGRAASPTQHAAPEQPSPLLHSKYPAVAHHSPQGYSVWTAPPGSNISPPGSPRILPFRPPAPLPPQQGLWTIPAGRLPAQPLQQQPQERKQAAWAPPALLAQQDAALQAALLGKCYEAWHSYVVDLPRHRAEEVIASSQRHLARCFWQWHLKAQATAEAAQKATGRHRDHVLTSAFKVGQGDLCCVEWLCDLKVEHVILSCSGRGAVSAQRACIRNNETRRKVWDARQLETTAGNTTHARLLAAGCRGHPASGGAGADMRCLAHGRKPHVLPL